MPKQDDNRHKEEFLALMAIFERLIDSVSDEDFETWEVLEELMALRADFAIHYALEGFDLEYDTALELLRTAEEDLTENEKARRNIVVAAVDNLVDFAIAEEYQVISEIEGFEELYGEELSEEEEYEEAIGIFTKYNDKYAKIENNDIQYSMIVAAQLFILPENISLMYMTQGDERVRPWHLQYEGFTAPKSRFPAWLVPPIEHACRCYLVEDTLYGKISDVKNAVEPTMPEWFNPTFKESVAFGGRIFSDEHPYFQIDKTHEQILKSISLRIKSKYFNGSE